MKDVPGTKNRAGGGGYTKNLKKTTPIFFFWGGEHLKNYSGINKINIRIEVSESTLLQN